MRYIDCETGCKTFTDGWRHDLNCRHALKEGTAFIPQPLPEAPKFPPKIMGQFAPDEDNGRWQGPYVFCPEQWSIAYDKPGDSWKPYDGELREVVFISIDEHEAVVAAKEKEIESWTKAVDRIDARFERALEENKIVQSRLDVAEALLRECYENAAQQVEILFGVGAHPEDPIEAQKQYADAIRKLAKLREHFKPGGA